MAGLRAVEGPRAIGRRLAGGRPVLGICVGMQVLFERGVEHGVETEGCDEWPGVVERLQAPVVPHMGWNTVDVPDGLRLFAGVEGERFYFVHSYAARSWELVTDGHTRRPLVDLVRARRRPVRGRGGERPAVARPSSTRRSPATPARPCSGELELRSSGPVSKERARRRAEREREAAAKAAARQREAERRARARARKQALTGWFPAAHAPAGRARRAAARRADGDVRVLFLLNLLVWLVRPDWAARLAALVVSAGRLPRGPADGVSDDDAARRGHRCPGRQTRRVAPRSPSALRLRLVSLDEIEDELAADAEDTPRDWLRYDAEAELVRRLEAVRRPGSGRHLDRPAPRHRARPAAPGAAGGTASWRCGARYPPSWPSSGTSLATGRGHRTSRPTRTPWPGSGTRPSTRRPSGRHAPSCVDATRPLEIGDVVTAVRVETGARHRVRRR